MFRALRRLAAAITAIGFTLSGIVLVPQGVAAARILQDWTAPEVSAEIHLRDVPPARYPHEADAALAEDDPELAQSILVLAAQRRIPVPAELTARVETALAERPGMLGDVWNGAVYGEADTTAGFAAAVTTDLMVVGDVRDLVRQAWAYPEHDPVVVGLAALGIGLTAATYLSAGSASPVKLGASILKAARKTGRLGAALSADLLLITRRAIDGEAMETAFRAARRLDWDGVRLASARMLRREATEELGTAGTALGGVASRLGPKGALDTLRASDSTAEIVRLGRVAERAGPSFRGMLRVAPRLGKLALKSGRMMVELALWIAGAALWLLWAVRTLFRFFRMTGSLLLSGFIVMVRGTFRAFGPARQTQPIV